MILNVHLVTALVWLPLFVMKIIFFFKFSSFYLIIKVKLLKVLSHLSTDLLGCLIVHLEGPELESGRELADGGQSEEELLC